ncbi:rab-like protein 3 isoform X1 [Limulus polyphemus]|uniref:Rab-like protein 3 isoform X1 n=1 Tax=Limulus polyphemus TaxID=6850 RepID=A0ABM1BFV0_LIMPO|nr:rab-like protein 3 isoform X1 [Limulus polyphemus]
MASINKVKVMVVGDSGVGKSAFVHLVCHSQPITNPSWTIGCSVDIKLHEYKEGTPSQKTYFVELWDIGGSSSHRNTRAVFYNCFQGIILIHDLTNRKSHQNLRKWLAELLCKEGNVKKNTGHDFDPEEFVDNQIPILIIGTKLDMVQQGLSPNRSSSVAEECGADEFYLDCHQAKSLAPGSTNAVKLSRFFDKVIERRYYSQNSSQMTTLLDRRRVGPLSPKLSHVD